MPCDIGFAHQELLCAFAVFVVIVDGTVVRGLETVEAAGVVVERQCGVEHFLGRFGIVLVFKSVKDFDLVSRFDAVIEIDLKRINADEIGNHLLGDLLFEAGLVETLIKRQHRTA